MSTLTVLKVCSQHLYREKVLYISCISVESFGSFGIDKKYQYKKFLKEINAKMIKCQLNMQTD